MAIKLVCVCRKYSVERQTTHFAINYYVRPDFEESFAIGSLELSRLERQVEDEYIATLQHNCYRERSYRKSLTLLFSSFNDSCQLPFTLHCIVSCFIPRGKQLANFNKLCSVNKL